MRILCVGSKPARASAIADALDGTAEACGMSALMERLEAGLAEGGLDGLLLEKSSFDELDDDAAWRLRRAAKTAAWIVMTDDGDRALELGADGTVDARASAEQIANELRRAVSARRDRQRWPRSFVERRALVVSG